MSIIATLFTAILAGTLGVTLTGSLWVGILLFLFVAMVFITAAMMMENL